jgi:hypothetical protein
MGLGFKDLSMGEGFNIVDDLNSKGQLPNSQISFYLTDDGDSEVTFGGYKAEYLASDIVWAPVKKESYWQVSIDDITFDNTPKGLCNGGCEVAVDTGTSMLAGPSELVDKLSNMVAAKADCSNFDSLPKLGFQIGDKVLNLQPDDYMDRSSSDCSFSLMALDVPPPKGPLFIFGDPFLRRFVTIFDRSVPRVGFAVAKHSGDTNVASMELISKVGTAVGNPGSPPSAGESPNAVDLHLDSGLMGPAMGDDSDDSSPPSPPPAPVPPPADSHAALAKTSGDDASSGLSAEENPFSPTHDVSQWAEQSPTVPTPPSASPTTSDATNLDSNDLLGSRENSRQSAEVVAPPPPPSPPAPVSPSVTDQTEQSHNLYWASSPDNAPADPDDVIDKLSSLAGAEKSNSDAAESKVKEKEPSILATHPEISTDEFWHPRGTLGIAASVPDGQNEYEKMLNDSPSRPIVNPASDTLAQSEKLPVKNEDDSSTLVAPMKSDADEPDSPSLFDSASTLLASPEQSTPTHFENPWLAAFGATSSPASTKPIKPVSIDKMVSTSNVVNGQDDFAVWSTLKSLDNPALKSSAADSESSDIKKQTNDSGDWASLANGGLWGNSGNIGIDDVLEKSSSKPVVETSHSQDDDDDVARMRSLLKDNSLLQVKKQGHQQRMISVKLFRGS